ncbi:MAG: hypothetical protein HY093_04960 [Candidatus Liptonbacteria bacterium]|nr:hypothetical protein [Candidatus Liptonbacteria bacterium]
MSMGNLEFLKQKYDLHNAEEVESAAKRTEEKTGEKISQDPEERIQNYLNRFQEILDRKDPEKRERGIEALKRILYDKFVIKPEEIPEGYFDNQRRIAREQGHGEVEITDETRGQLTEVIIADQQSSLDTWVDYLSSPDATYPDWLKYYATRSVLGMGEYDKAKKQFTKRSKGTTKPFPDLNREALAYVLDAIEKKHKGEKISLVALEAEDKEKFSKLIQSENFAKLYAWAIEKVTPASVDQLSVTLGKWMKYDQNSDHMPLVESLQGHGTGWCTAGESTAETQLKGGDFYVYYSLDRDGKPTIPRAAIRTQEGGIAEVRGVAAEQNLDSHIGGVVQEKLKEFPDGAQYEKKARDMKFLTAIENKVKSGRGLQKDDLVFLYEINGKIEGFGYQRDPRILELREQRNPEEDMPVVFECAREQIARRPEDINENTMAYVGKLEPGIFQKLPDNLEHIYTSFPDRKIRQEKVEIGGKSAEQLLKELKTAGIKISEYAKDMFQSPEFVSGKNSEEATLIRLTVADLGFTGYTRTDRIYERAKELGLELCPAEVGPHYRLKYQNQPLGEWIYIGMKQISDSDGPTHVSELGRFEDGLWLDDDWAGPAHGWSPEDEGVFRKSLYFSPRFCGGVFCYKDFNIPTFCRMLECWCEDYRKTLIHYRIRIMEIAVVLHNIRSVYNVASVFRTADGAGVAKIYLVGVTPSPLDRFGKFRVDFAKVALGAEKTVEWEHFKNFGAVYKKLRKSAGGRTPAGGGYEILAVEQDKRSIPYYKYRSLSYPNDRRDKRVNKKLKKITLAPRRTRDKCALIFGEETRGLPKSVLDKCDKILEIPMRGKMVRQAHHPRNEKGLLRRKESLNVSVAAGIVIFAFAYRC